MENMVTFADLTSAELLTIAASVVRPGNDPVVLYLIGRELLTRYRRTCSVVDEMALVIDALEEGAVL